MVSSIHRKNSFLRFANAAAALMAIVVSLASWSSAAEVVAELDRDSVPAGNAAVMTLRISGGKAEKPEIPAISNLIIESRGQSQQMQMINFHVTVTMTYTYIVGSQTPGDYQIPPFTVMVDGKKLSTEPLNLKVLDAGAAQPAAGTPPNSAGSPPSSAEEADEGEKRFGFLTVELAANDRKHAYVGEIAPVRIRAWLPAASRAQLRSGIQPEGKAFTLHNVSSQPQQTEEVREGKRYTVITWFGGMSATKAGKYPASLSLNATVAVRDPSALRQPRRRTGGPFDDPFFDNVFDQMNTPMIQKEVTLKSDDQEIEVRPLPTEGRPKGFTGAVGEFKFDSFEIPNTWKTGEPQQIAAGLSGTGNFSLMNAPELTPADAWKTYPGKGEFNGGDQASFSGSKSFKFSAVPRKGGDQEVSLAFSYFDPTAGAYHTISSPIEKIHVDGTDVVDDVPATNPAEREPEKTPEKKIESLAPQHLAMTAPATLTPLVSRPAFYLSLVLSALFAAMGWGIAWIRRRRADPKRRAQEVMEKAVRQALETVASSTASGDVAGYFAAARLALQHRLGALWNQSAQAITSAEVRARISHDSPVARFFREADCYEYSRQSSREILPEWQALFDEALATLTPSK